MELVDFQYLEDAMQARCLRWLNLMATKRPAVMVALCGAVQPILDEVFLHGQSAVTLEAAHALLQTLTSDDDFLEGMNSVEFLNETLDDLGFSGLWRACSLGLSDDLYYNSFGLTEKLIEVNFFSVKPPRK
jgi:neurofibromin 1